MILENDLRFEKKALKIEYPITWRAHFIEALKARAKKIQDLLILFAAPRFLKMRLLASLPRDYEI